MYSLKYYTPVALFVVRSCVSENADVFPDKGERVFVITSRFAGGVTQSFRENSQQIFSPKR